MTEFACYSGQGGEERHSSEYKFYLIASYVEWYKQLRKLHW
jgi:hypothetical protein